MPEILVGNELVLRLFGVGITEDLEIAFTNEHENKGALCDKRSTDKFSVSFTKWKHFLEITNFNFIGLIFF